MWGKGVLITLAVVLFTLLAAKLFLPSYVTTLGESRELTLRSNLHTMRAVIDQYTLDLHRRPRSLDDLVNAGYLKFVPLDPMTGRRDTWVVGCSSNPATPGVESISAGDPSATLKATAHCD